MWWFGLFGWVIVLKSVETVGYILNEQVMFIFTTQGTSTVLNKKKGQIDLVRGSKVLVLGSSVFVYLCN